MARGDLSEVVLLVGGAFVAYRLALAGKLGQGAYDLVVSLRAPVSGTGGAGGTGGNRGGGNRGGGGSGGGSGGGGTGEACSNGDYACMVRANPNFPSQMREWQVGACVNRSFGGNPHDWDEFRRHQGRIGAPDPGPIAPSNFTQFSCSGE